VELRRESTAKHTRKGLAPGSPGRELRAAAKPGKGRPAHIGQALDRREFKSLTACHGPQPQRGKMPGRWGIVAADEKLGELKDGTP